MKKIWIIHNSLHGNSKRISNQIAEGLNDSFEINVESIKNISPENIAEDKPYGLIIAVRILAFRSDPEMQKFLKELDKVITQSFSKVAYFSTHALGWKKLFIRGMQKTLKKIECVDEICPEYLEVKMQTAEGPAVEGADVKVAGFISTLNQFMAENN